MTSRGLTAALLSLALVVSARDARAGDPVPGDEAPVAPADPPVPEDVVKRLADGRAALDAGRVDEACALFSKAAESGFSEALLASGQCHELQGRTASAWRAYTDASLAAGREGAADREDRARSLAGKIAPRLSKLRIDVTSPVAGHGVRRNGVAVDPATYGALVPVDPGRYTIVASAPGYVDHTVAVDVKPDADARVVVVPALVRPAAMTGPAKPVVPPPPNDGVVRTHSPLGVAGFVTTSFGAVGIATGIAFGVMALNEASEAEDNPLLCPNKVCSEAGMAVVDEARTKSTVSTVAFSIGGTSLAAGVTLFLIRELTDIEKPKSDAPKTGVTVTPQIAPGWVGATVAF